MVTLPDKFSKFIYNTFRKDKIWKEIKSNHFEILDGNRFWLISDMHFNHANIIRWCRKDCFSNVRQMNKRLVKNWNYRVGNFDKVFSLGDFGDFRFKQQLKGNITIVKGNHDKKQWNRQYLIDFKDLKFLVVHDPDNATSWFDGDWIIHGHHHVNSPFIDITKKRVNVSVEAINYSPLNMEDLYAIVKESQNYNDDRWVL